MTNDQEKAPGAAPEAAAPTVGAGSAAQTGAAAQPPADEPAARKPHRRAWTTVGIVAAIIVVAGAGFWVWHEQPGFCNAVCHSPMDYYVESYDSGDPHLGITAHAADGVTCLKCHDAELTTQISELMAWTSDNYPVTEDGRLATGKEFATEQFCAKSGCHHELGDSYDEITANLWGFAGNDEKYNPHASHQDLALECGDCHGIHEANVLACNECHDLTMPEGWEAPSEQ